jgi:hypothetical protein
MNQSHTLPAAILVAGAMIGAGLYLGLRDRPPAVASPTRGEPDALTTDRGPSRAEEVDPPQGGSPQAPPPVGVGPGAPEDKDGDGLPPAVAPNGLQEKAAKSVNEELDELRPRIVKECWAPSVKKDPAPAKAMIPARFLFGVDGKQTGYSIAEPEAASRADVSECLRAMNLSLRIPAPGAVVAVQVGIKLP